MVNNVEPSDARQPQFCLIKTFTRIELARPANLGVAWVGLWSGLQSSAFRRNHVGEMNYGVLILATVITGKMLVKDTWGPVRCGGRMVDRCIQDIRGCLADRYPAGNALPFPRRKGLVPVLVPAGQADGPDVEILRDETGDTRQQQRFAHRLRHLRHRLPDGRPFIQRRIRIRAGENRSGVGKKIENM